MMQELVNAHTAELNASSRKIEHRAAYAEISKMDRLERALKSARGKMQLLPNLSARTN